MIRSSDGADTPLRHQRTLCVPPDISPRSTNVTTQINGKVIALIRNNCPLNVRALCPRSIQKLNLHGKARQRCRGGDALENVTLPPLQRRRACRCVAEAAQRQGLWSWMFPPCSIPPAE